MEDEDITTLTKKLLDLKARVREAEELLKALKSEHTRTEATLEVKVRQRPSLVRVEGNLYGLVSRNYDLVITQLFEA